MNFTDTINVASSKLWVKMIPVSVLIDHLLKLIFNKEKATITSCLEVSNQGTVKELDIA